MIFDIDQSNAVTCHDRHEDKDTYKEICRDNTHGISIDIYFNTLALTVRHYTQLQTRKSIFNLTLVPPHCGFQDYELS